MNSDEKLRLTISLLREKADETGRLPKRSDFSPEQVCLIKQKLGPWPRALERAGLKQPAAVSAKNKSRIKRERRKKELKRLRKMSHEKDISKEIGSDIGSLPAYNTHKERSN